MSKPRRDKTSFPLEDAIKQRKAIPHEFVLDAIAPLSPATRSMFGCLAVYAQDKIVLILRDKGDGTPDDGVWLATTEEHHQSLPREFPRGWVGPRVIGVIAILRQGKREQSSKRFLTNVRRSLEP